MRKCVQLEVVGLKAGQKKKLFLSSIHPSTSAVFGVWEWNVGHEDTDIFVFRWLEDKGRRVRPNIHTLRCKKVEKPGHKPFLCCFFFSFVVISVTLFFLIM